MPFVCCYSTPVRFSPLCRTCVPEMRVFSGTNVNSECGKSAFYAIFHTSESVLVIGVINMHVWFMQYNAGLQLKFITDGNFWWAEANSCFSKHCNVFQPEKIIFIPDNDQTEIKFKKMLKNAVESWFLEPNLTSLHQSNSGILPFEFSIFL